ncbi:MAG: NAD-dependent epimerase/dehydratase family protein [Phaeodactylibacter sp.]|nr:NAD-dependent epimerase/dehydratase family protein [Phaeodactylibacter sp.]MCB9300482.1 NAD-dependent epimerase/dehydratase family protein [Lewinellaceae bacterium]
MKIKAIITGATGMVGEGVLHVALADPRVEKVLVINRRSCGVQHEKLKELLHKDFHDLSAIESQLSGYNACYFCLGVSSVGMKEEQYRHLTYDLTLHVAQTLARLNPDMTFCYISGAGTDSSEQGRSMWARVKGKTENDLQKLPFKAVYNFRPGYIQPMQGMKNTLKAYKVLGFLYPLFRLIFPKYVVRLEEIGRAMLNATLEGYTKPVLECPDIVELAA